MILTYYFTENDFLQMQLYFLKERKDLKKVIIKSLVIWFIILSIIVLILLVNNDKFDAILLSIGGVGGLIFLPNRIKTMYFKRLRKDIQLYKSKFNQLITLNINEDYFNTVGTESESKINISQLQKIIETKSHFFLKLNPEVIIIPKSEMELRNFDKNELYELAKRQKVEVENQLHWKW
jgi:hypothetical protein